MNLPEKHVPKEMRACKQWVGALLTEREGGKWEKQPVDPRSGRLAKVNDPATWGSFAEAVAWRDRQPPRPGARYGVGFVFTANDPFVGIDLDHCYDERRNLSGEAAAIVRRLDSYTELSVSGTGLHIIVLAELPPGGRRKGGVEMYDRSRFFVVTGAHVDPTPPTVQARGAEVAALHRELFGAGVAQVPVAPVARLPQPGSQVGNVRHSATLTDAQVIAKAGGATNGAKFCRLVAGQWQGLYPSQSEADLALCSLLAFWTGRDAAQMDRLFRQSGLYRPKWDVRHFGDGRTYGQERIQVAIASATTAYGENQAEPVRAWPEDRGYGEGAANFFPVAVALDEPAWLADHPDEAWMRGGPVIEAAKAEIAQAMQAVAQLTPQPVAPQIAQQMAQQMARIAPEVEAGECPPLPEGALVDPALGEGVAPWVREYVAYSRTWAPRAYADFHVANALFILSTVAGRRIVTHWGGPRYGNLCLAQVASTSAWTKTTAVKVARDFIEQAGLSYLLLPDESTPQAFYSVMADQGPEDWGALGPEKLRLTQLRVGRASQRGWIYEEFGEKVQGMMRENGPMSNFRSMLKRLDDCQETFEYGTVSRGLEVLAQPYLTMIANLTPADFGQYARAGAPLWRDGSWARWTFIAPPASLRPLKDRFPSGERVPPAGLVAALVRWHEALGIPLAQQVEVERADGKKAREVVIERPAPVVYPLGAGVEAAINAYDDGLRDLAHEARIPVDLEGGYCRLAEKALRVALLLASIDGAPEIALRHWAAAQGITERWRASLHAMYAAVNGGGPTTTFEQAKVQAEERILRELRKRGAEGASANQVRVSTGLSVETCVDVMKSLAEGGALQVARKNQKGMPVYMLAAEA